MAGTAPHARRWLLLEADGPWGHDAARESRLSPAVVERVTEWEQEGAPGRVLLIRRPRRQGHTGSTVIIADIQDVGTTIRREKLDRIDDILELDLGPRSMVAPVDEPLLLVCVHGRRDACCARLGVPVHAALAERLGEDAVWQCTHFGGHRFAANVLALPLGVMLGRVRPPDAPALVESLLAGQLPLERARGRVLHPPEVQAAELTIHAHVGTRSISEIAYVGGTDGVHRFTTPKGELRVSVDRNAGPSLPVRCGGDPEPGVSLVARLVSDGEGGRSTVQPVAVVGDPDEGCRERS
jgi:hypothetical protein